MSDIKEIASTERKFIDIKDNLKRFDIDVVKLLKIENHRSKIDFETELLSLKQRKTKEFNPNIMKLYHGTQANWNQLADEGLDERLSRKGRFGRGIYFSDNPQKCCKYASKNRASDPENSFILICKVILGDIKEFKKNEEDRNLKKEPIKETVNGKVIYYDSVKGQPKDYTEYVLYDKRRVMIKFIVFYSPDVNKQLVSIISNDEISKNSSDEDSDKDSEGSIISENDDLELEQTNANKSEETPIIQTEAMIKQKSQAMLKLLDIRNKVLQQDLIELIIAFIQTYGHDDSLDKFFPEILATLDPTQYKPSSSKEVDAVTEVMNCQIKLFREVTGCDNVEICKKFLTRSNMVLDSAITAYYDENLT